MTPLSDATAKALAPSAAASTPQRATARLLQELTHRMTPAQSVKAATEIVERYPNGGKDAGKGYIGALAQILARYPASVAQRCASIDGVTSVCKFLPTVANIVSWCDKRAEWLQSDFERQQRIDQQLAERAEFARIDAAKRNKKAAANYSPQFGSRGQ